jgi:hypothetical protein
MVLDLIIVAAHFVVIAGIAMILDRVRHYRSPKNVEPTTVKKEGSAAPQLDPMSQSAL